jgi:valyl-tRNA synthetase
MSFITEEIFQKLPPIPGSVRPSALIVAAYPMADDSRRHPEAAAGFAVLQELTRLVRGLRSEFGIPPSRAVALAVAVNDDFTQLDFLRAHAGLIESLTWAASIDFDGHEAAKEGSVTLVGTGFEVYAYVRDAIDVKAEVIKLRKSIAKTERLMETTDRKLASPGFLSNAGEEIVEKERAKKREFTEKLSRMREYLSQLE